MPVSNAPDMTEPVPNPPAHSVRSGVVRGVAGCFLTAAMTLVGAVLGTLVGWNQMPPKWDPMKGGSEWHTTDFERLAWLAGGFLVGAVCGMLLGIVLSVILFRPRKPAG